MRFFLQTVVILCLTFSVFADTHYAPTSSNAITGGASYCQSATASAVNFTYNTCVSGAGGSAFGDPMTVYWYKNSSNSTSGGTLVSTTSTTSATTSTGVVSYTPLTSTVGVSYYYCIISYSTTTGSTCGTGGTVTSVGTALVTVLGTPSTITGTTSVAPSVSSTLSNTTANGTWSSSNTSVASINASTGVMRGVAAGACTITYTTGCGSAATTMASVVTALSWYQDSDNDGWGNPLVTISAAAKPSGYVLNNLDYNDANANTTVFDSVGPRGFTISGTNTYGAMAFAGNTPYVFFLNNSNTSYVLKYSGSSWSQVGSTGATSNFAYRAFTVSSTGTPYVVTQNGFQAGCTYFNGSSWATLGSSGFTPGLATNLAVAVDASDVPYVAFTDGSASSKLSVMRYVSSAWSVVGSYGISTNGTAANAITGDGFGNIYVAYQDASTNKANVVKWNGSSWALLGSANFSASTVSNICIAVSRDGIPYVGFTDAAVSGKATVMKFDGTSWAIAGTAGISTGSVTYPSLTVGLDGTPYMTFADNGVSNKNVMMKFDGTSWSAVVSASGFSLSSATYGTVGVNKLGVPTAFYMDANYSSRGTAMTIVPFKVAPTTPVITASTTSSCSTATVTLTVSSGSLNDASTWVWYKGSCGGTYVGTGTSITVSVAATTTFYCRGENALFADQGNCGSVQVSITGTPLWYRDADNDGWGSPTDTQRVCAQPTGYILNGLDCSDASVNNTVTYNVGSANVYPSGGTATRCILNIDKNNIPFVYFLNNTSAGYVMKYTSGAWSQVGSSPTGNITYISMAVNSSSVPYIVTQNGYQASAQRYNGSSWEAVGASNFTPALATDLSLTIDGSDVPYMSFIDGSVSSRVSVMKYNGANWVVVGSYGFSPGTAANTSVATDGTGAVYVAFQDGTNSNKVTVMKYNGSTWATLGTAGFSDGTATNITMAVDVNGKAYVLYSDATYSNKAVVKKYDGASWSTMGTSGFSTGAVTYTSIKLDAGNNPYVGYTDAGIGKASVMKYSGSAWTSVTTAAGFSPGSGNYASLAIDATGIPYLAFADGTISNKVAVVKAAPIAVQPTRPTISASTTTIATCGGSVTLTATGTLGSATNWYWYSDTTAPYLGVGTTFTTVPAAASNVYYARAEGSCLVNQGIASSPITITVTAGPVATPADISGTTPICRATPVTYSNTVTGGRWTTSNAAIARVDSVSGSVTGVASGTAIITYTMSNSCGSSRKYKSVTVESRPSALAGTTTMCVGTLTALSDSVSGGTWSSSNTGVATINSGGTISGASAGTTNISYAVNNACGSNSVGALVTVNAIPTAGAITAAPTGYCIGAGGVITLSETGTPTGSGSISSYNWSGPLGYSTTSASTSVTFTPTSTLSSGYYSLTVTYPGCVSAAVRSAYVTISPSPVAYSVTGGTGCGYPGITVGLSNSQVGINYQLYKDGVISGGTVSGTGSAISFGLKTATGVYTVAGIGSASCTLNMTGSATVISAPGIFDIPSTTACVATGVAITLSGSESGINYQLYRGATTVGSTVPGTGSPLSFGTQSTIGSYYVIATGSGGCFDTMNYRSTVVSGLTAYTVAGGPGCTFTLGTTVTLSGSQVGVSYQLNNGVFTAGSPVIGTGNDISFGLQTTAGTYTATGTTSGCTTQSMTGSSVVYTSPTAFNVTGGYAGCASPGLTIGLSGSTSGVNYQLYNGASAVGSTVPGTGAAISFGTKTAIGTYKVVATAVTGGCTMNMNDSAVIGTVPNTPGAITGITTFCRGAVTTLSDTTAGGVWSSSATGVATVTAAGVVSGVTAGSANISYTVTNSCGSSYAIAAITVNALPAIVPSATTTICNGGSTTISASGATTYSWSPSASLSTSTGSPVTASPTSSTVYTVTGTTSGCSATGTVSVTVNAIPTIASVTPSATALCYGATLTLSAGTAAAAAGSGTLTSYNWSGPNSYSVTTAGAVTSLVTNTTSATGSYSLSVTYTGAGCTSAKATTATATVAPLPSIGSITALPTPVCTGSPITLTAVGTTGGAGTLTSYNWSGPNSYTSSGTITTASFSPTTTAASGSYSVNVVYSGVGCTSPGVSSAAVTVNGTPTISVSPTVTICTGGSTTLTATGGTSYTWSPATGLSPTTGSTVVASPTSTTTYTVTGTTSGCSAIGTVTVTVNPKPTIASVTPSSTALCYGSTLTLTGGTAAATAGSGTLTSYNWIGPNAYSQTTATNVTSTTVNTSSATGIYSLSVTYSGAGCTSTNAVTPSVTVAPLPAVASITPSSTTLCTGNVLTLTAGSITGGAGSLTSYNWSGPNTYSASGATATNSLTASTTAASGVYSVYVIYSGTGCTGPAVSSSSVTVNATPTIGSSAAVTICTGGSTTLTATGGTTYTWSPATGLSPTTGASVAANPTTTTTYTVTGTTSGCSSTATTVVTVNARPTIASVTPSSTALCYGATLTLTGGTAAATAGSGVLTSYNWAGPNAYSLTTATNITSLSTNTTSASGVYSLSVTYSGAGCTSTNAVTSAVTVAPLPTPASITALPSPICTGNVLTLTAVGTTGGAGSLTSYNWTGPNTYSASGTTTTNSFTAATTAASGVYSVYVVYSGTGCTGPIVSSPSVTVNATPTIGSSGAITICNGGSTTLTATGGTTYTWSPATGLSPTTGSSVVANPATTTTYTVTGTNTGCSSTATAVVTVNPKPTIASVTPSSTTLCYGATLTLTGGAAAATAGSGTLTSYNWSGPNAYSLTTAGNITSLTTNTTSASGVYSLSVTYSGAGCTSTNAVTSAVTVNTLPLVSSITPSSTNLCIGATLTLTAAGASGAGTLSSYNWTGPNSYNTSGTATFKSLVTTTAAQSGAYSLTVTYPGTGCVSLPVVTSPTVTVNALPTISGITASSACIGSTLTLTAGAPTGPGTLTSYNWSGPPSYSTTTATSSTSLSIANVNQGGVYTLSVTYPGTGCKSANVVTTPSVTVNAAVVAGTISGSTAIFPGLSSTLTVTGASGGTGVWSSSNTSVATVTTGSTTATVYAVTAGSVVISYTTTNACGASGVATISISTQQPPAITGVSPNVGIPGATVTISGTGFDATAANNVVYFGATKVIPSVASATALTVTVPVGATFQPVSVLNTANGLSAFADSAFVPRFDTSLMVIDSIYLKSAINYITDTGSPTPYTGAIGDINGDGKPDLVVNNRGTNSFSLFLNNGTPGVINASSFTFYARYTTLGLPNNVKLADIDGDGKLDVVLSLTGSTYMNVFLNTTSATATPTFGARTDISAGANITAVAAIADFDGDGKPDIVASLPYTAAMGVFRNTSSVGSASFSSLVSIAAGAAPSGMAIADFDGDGKPDVATANSGFNGTSYLGSTATVARNTSTPGTISFATPATLTTGSGPVDIAAGDMDGDKKPDILVTNLNDGNISIFRNIATSGSIVTGSFSTRANFVTGAFATGLAVADLNSDGKLDVVVTNGAGTVSVLRNRTTSTTFTFAPKTDYTAGGALPTTVTIGDLDGDKYPDVVVGNQGSNTVSVFRNNPAAICCAYYGYCFSLRSRGHNNAQQRYCRWLLENGTQQCYYQLVWRGNGCQFRC